MLDDISTALYMFFSRVYVRFLAYVRRSVRAYNEQRVQRLRGLNRRTVALAVFTFALLLLFYMEVVRPPQEFPYDKLVTIEEGDALSDIAGALEERDVVQSAWWLSAVIRAKGGEQNVKAGDYLFKHPRSIFSVARIITSGTFGLEPIKITVAEGSTVADMSIIYGRELLRFDPQTFFVKAIEFEGYLFPDTYYFLPNVTEDAVIQAMRDNFGRRTKTLEMQINGSGRSLAEIVTMASILEKEARNERDRRMIAGVLWNRIEAGMLLQVDATFVYTHGKGTYDITLAELLDKENLYNTYTQVGLPPSPIAAPGLSSLRAAINPIENDYLFYLADKKGVTYYSETYEEHLRKKRLYVD
jgi:UPF0755 protein